LYAAIYTVISGVNSSFPNLYKLKRNLINDSTDYRLIDETAAGRGWLIDYSHLISAGNSTFSNKDISEAGLEARWKYIIENYSERFWNAASDEICDYIRIRNSVKLKRFCNTQNSLTFMICLKNIKKCKYKFLTLIITPPDEFICNNITVAYNGNSNNCKIDRRGTKYLVTINLQNDIGEITVTYER